MRRSLYRYKVGFGVLVCAALAGCGTNLKSIPFSSSRPVMNAAAREMVAKHEPSNLDITSLPFHDVAEDGKIITVAVSGGGMRAAAFTLGVMAELETIRGSADHRSAYDTIDRVSTVSGGTWAMVGVLAQKKKAPTQTLAQNRQQMFERFANLDVGRRMCWAQRLMAKGDDTLTDGLTFGKLYAEGSGPGLPQIFVNSSLFPAQAPFVFTDGYLSRFEVDNLSAPCIGWQRLSEERALSEVPIGMAAAASSAVPAFTKAYASTSLCDSPEGYSFCHPQISERWTRRYLQLLDGGIYDNIGWKTPLELALRPQELKAEAHKGLLVVNSDESPDYLSVGRWAADNNNIFKLAMATSFPNQNATFARLHKSAFEALGYKEPVVLDFAAAAGFREDQLKLLEGLDELASHAATQIACFTDPDKQTPAISPLSKGSTGVLPLEQSVRILRASAPDCLSENFYRAGYIHKTTYKYEEDYFLLRYQLGQLVVRMHADEIRDAFDLNKPV